MTKMTTCNILIGILNLNQSAEMTTCGNCDILDEGVGHFSGFTGAGGSSLVESSELRAENTSQSCSVNVNSLFGLPMSPTT